MELRLFCIKPSISNAVVTKEDSVVKWKKLPRWDDAVTQNAVVTVRKM